MLKTLKICTALCLLISYPALATEENPSPKQLLKSMIKAQEQLNYQISFVQTNLANLQTFSYKHANVESKSYAQLSTLDGVKQDIVRRDNLVSYFQPHFTPFSLQSKHIVDYLPPILAANIDKLAEYYDFSIMGKNRVADRLVQVIKVMPKDNFRYQYVLFIDEESQLLLRSDMLDRDNNLLQSFHVVNLYIGDELKQLAPQLNQLNFPPLLSDTPNSAQKISQWQTKWLPKGFVLISENVDSEDKQQNVVESRLYSDGLFSFTIYVADKILNDKQEGLLLQGTNTIYSENIGDKEVTIIGQIPIATAKRIVQDLQFK